jgi:monoamine oxidase
VTRVDYNSDRVQVTHNGKVSEADYVIVSVPLGVLKSGRIQFSPELPQHKKTAIEKVPMNCVNKFLLIFDEAFWDDELYICYTAEQKDKYNYFVNLKKAANVNALMTFAYADYARATESMSDSQIIGDIMSHLSDMYGENIPYPKTMLRTRWNSNENSFGSYSYPGVGTNPQFFGNLAKSVDNKLFFAGEHTSKDFFGTAHGAYHSGMDVAEEIAELE